MAIVKSTTKSETLRENYVPRVEPVEHKTVVVDTKYTPLSNLITHIEGAQWKVDLYQQVIDKDSSVTGHNPTKQSPYQQYHCIHEYILKVNSPLSSTQDEERKTMTVTGSGMCYPPIVPNVGDMFIADIGDGRSGIFQITSSERKSIFKEAVYEVNYALIDYASGDRVKDLEQKVVKHSYFLMDFLEHGQNPLLSDEEWYLIKVINRDYGYMVEKYIDMFFSSYHKTFLVPYQAKPTYEPFITRMVSHWYSSSDNIKLMYLKTYNVVDDPYFNCTSIYDAIEKRDIRSLKEAFVNVSKVNVKHFHYDPRIQSLRFSGMNFVLLPKDPLPYTYDNDTYRCLKRQTGDDVVFETRESPSGRPKATLDGIPLIPVLDLNRSYVVSGNFYLGELEGLSHLEIQLLNYFERDSLNPQVIKRLIEDWEDWDVLDKFYYTPILLTLMKATVRELK